RVAGLYAARIPSLRWKIQVAVRRRRVKNKIVVQRSPSSRRKPLGTQCVAPKPTGTPKSQCRTPGGCSRYPYQTLRVHRFTPGDRGTERRAGCRMSRGTRSERNGYQVIGAIMLVG